MAMKRVLLFVVFVACHSKEGSTLDASVASASAEEVSEASPSQSSVPLAKLTDFDGGAPKRAKVGGGVLLCATHEVWTPPDGFDVEKVGDGFAARRDHRLVAIAYPPHADDSYATVVARFVTGEITWEPPAMKKVDDWHAEQTVHGRARGLIFTIRTLYAGVDAKTGKGRAGLDLASATSDVIWITAARTERESDTLAQDASKNTLKLVDHACECGYDCLPARK